MTPNNNFSVIPWYGSLSEQNARKWWTYGRVYPLFVPCDTLVPFQLTRPHRAGAVSSVSIYTRDGALVGDFSSAIIPLLSIDSGTSEDVIVYPGGASLGLPIGQYYAVLSDGTQTWYSEVFTAVEDLSGYLKLEWWDERDFVMDAGRIIYVSPVYRNIAYLQSDIAKPDYPFEEEGEERDGYFFPLKQISEKRYRFSFLSSEYLLDVLRFVRMADHAQITKGGKLYVLDTFLMTPEWEPNGDVAAVSAEFDTDTVAKKVGTLVARETLTVTPTTLGFSAPGGVVAISIKTAGAWTLSVPVWITASKSSGVGNDTVSLSADANTGSEARTATATVQTALSGLTQSILIVQNAPDEDYLEVEPLSLDFMAAGEIKKIHISSNVFWQITLPGWLIADRLTGFDDAEITLTAGPNSGAELTGTVIVEDLGGGLPDVNVSVRQAGAVTLSVLPSSVTLPTTGGTFQIQITTNGSWTLTLPYGFSADKSSGTGDDTVTITVPSGTAGTTSIWVNSVELGTHETVSVTRAAAYLSVSPNSLDWAVTGGSKTITITASGTWSLSLPPWLSADKSTGTGNDTVTLTAGANTGAALSGSVTVTQGALTAEVSVSQAASSAEYLSVSPLSLTPPAEASTAKLTIEASGTWTITGLPAWITASKLTGTGDDEVTLSFAANASTTARAVSLTVTQGALERTVNILQSAAGMYCETVPSSLVFAATGGTATLSVESNTGWKLTLPAWLSTSDPLIGTGNAALVLTATGNGTGSARTGSITVEPSVQGEFPSFTVPLSQPAAYINFSPDPVVFSADGESIAVTVNAVGAWTISNIASIPSWLSVTASTGPAGSTAITFTATTNGTAETRQWTPVFQLDAFPAFTEGLDLAQPAAATPIAFGVCVKAQNRAAEITFPIILTNNRTGVSTTIQSSLAGTIQGINCMSGDSFTVVTAPPANLVQLAWSGATGTVFLRTGRVGSQTFQLSALEVEALAGSGDRLEIRHGYYIAAGFMFQDPTTGDDKSIAIPSYEISVRLYAAIASGRWVLNLGAVNWLSAQATQGTGQDVDVTAAANTGAARSGTFTINSNSSSSIPINLTIPQEGGA